MRKVLILLLFLFCSCIARFPKSIDSKKMGVNPPNRWATKLSENSKNNIFLNSFDWAKELGGNKLKKLIFEALKNNPDLEKASGNIKMAHGNTYISGAERMPLLNFIFNGGRKKQNFIGFPGFGGSGVGPTSSISESHGFSFDLSWEIDIWGRVLAKKKSSLASYQISLENKRALGLSIAAQTAKAYFSCLEAKAQIELSKEALKNYQKSEESIRQSLGVDTATSQLRLAMVDVETAKSSLAKNRLLLLSNVRQLQALLGRYPSGKIEELKNLNKKIWVKLALKKYPPAGLPSELLLRRPDIIAAERQVASSKFNLREAKLTLLPKISLNTSKGILTEEFNSVFDKSFNVWNIAGNLIQPLLSGNAITGGIFLKKGEVKRSIAEYRKVVLMAFSEVENAMSSEKLLKQQEIALSSASDLAHKAYLNSLEDFSDGSADQLTILTAQKLDISLRSQLINLRKLILHNRINLHLALGGDFILRDFEKQLIEKTKK